MAEILTSAHNPSTPIPPYSNSKRQTQVIIVQQQTLRTFHQASTPEELLEAYADWAQSYDQASQPWTPDPNPKALNPTTST
mmetsp:Transcript_24179/g.37987  ORF Transcript_24179/g.37987 Transcript_24179/m.37987 type:complete len:81 (-) Transcript_24179:2665-2907(-)